MELRGNSSERETVPASLRVVVKRYQLLVACLVIALCFFAANDIYGATKFVKKNRDLLKGDRKVVDYMAAKRAQLINAFPHSDLKKRYLIDPRRAQQKSLLRAFAGGDTCNTPSETVITSLPYSDPAGNLVGKADNYDLPADITAPTVTACPSCTAQGGINNGGSTPGSSGPRGAVFGGTGAGPDAAYRIAFNQSNANITVTMDPTNAADDLALIVYGTTCSSVNSDAIVIDDNNAGGGAETVTITTMPAGGYHIVVDTYSYYYYYGQIDPGGPYTLTVNCVTGQPCIQPAGPLAAGVMVTGKVLNGDGGGLVNSKVTLTDQHGVARTTRTGARGEFTFDDVEVGQTYIVTVRANRLRFAPRVIQIMDTLTNVEFSPEDY